MKATHQIEILENHCWEASQSQGVQIAKAAKAKGQKTIPFAELPQTIRQDIEEHFEGRRPEHLDKAEVTRIHGMDHDDDEVSYYIDLHIPE